MAGEREVRTQYEGELRWVEASGTGANTWQTASAIATAAATAAWAARSGLIGYVQAGLSFTKANNFVAVANRGVPNHHKNQGFGPVEVAFTVLHGITADYPSANRAIGPSASMGFSVDTYNFELKQRVEEVATGTGIYYQFYKGCLPSKAFSEAEAGDTLAFTVRFLGVSGWNSTGFLG
jgi:hypothetical protein